MLCATKSHIHPYLCWQCVGDCGVRTIACTRARSAVCKQPHAGCIELLTETLEWFRYLLTLTTSALGQLLLALVHSQGDLCAKVMTAFLNEGKLMGYCMLRLCLHAVSTRCGFFLEYAEQSFNLVVWASKRNRRQQVVKRPNDRRPTKPGVSRRT